MAKTCPSCFVGLCKFHPGQDHGASLKQKGATNTRQVINSLYAELIEKKLVKKRADDAAEAYEQLEREAEAAAHAAHKAAGSRRFVSDAAAAMGAWMSRAQGENRQGATKCGVRKGGMG